MKFLPFVYVAMSFTLTTAFTFNAYAVSDCAETIASQPILSITGFQLSTLTTQCMGLLPPSAANNYGSFSLMGCQNGGSVTLFSDLACQTEVTNTNAAICGSNTLFKSMIINLC